MFKLDIKKTQFGETENEVSCSIYCTENIYFGDNFADLYMECINDAVREFVKCRRVTIQGVNYLKFITWIKKYDSNSIDVDKWIAKDSTVINIKKFERRVNSLAASKMLDEIDKISKQKYVIEDSLKRSESSLKEINLNFKNIDDYIKMNNDGDGGYFSAYKSAGYSVVFVKSIDYKENKDLLLARGIRYNRDINLEVVFLSNRNENERAVIIYEKNTNEVLYTTMTYDTLGKLIKQFK